MTDYPLRGRRCSAILEVRSVHASHGRNVSIVCGRFGLRLRGCAIRVPAPHRLGKIAWSSPAMRKAKSRTMCLTHSISVTTAIMLARQMFHPDLELLPHRP